MKNTPAMIVIAMLLNSCRRDVLNDPIPQCMRSRIAQFASQDLCDGSDIKLYSFQGRMVYVFNAQSCYADGASEVVSEDCEGLGILGGIAGNMTIQGEAFSNAEFIRVVWPE